MTPVNMQGTGDCFRACVASILNIPIEFVPDFVAGEEGEVGQEWVENLFNWCDFRDYEVLIVPVKGTSVLYSGYYIAVGRHKSTGGYHAVVYYEGQMVHDPNPSREGIVEPVELIFIFRRSK